jgi:hypothetical protein
LPSRLPSLAPSRSALGGGAPVPFEHAVWLRESAGPDGTVFRLGRDRGRFVASWEGIGSVSASARGDDVEVAVERGLDPADERKWRTGAVRALLRHIEGRPTLHASAVALGGRALVFIGASGDGKSTCAADLCARHGASLLADDLTEIDVAEAPPVVLPTEDSHWLLADSAVTLGFAEPRRRKDPLRSARPATGPVPLGAVIALSFADGAPALTPLVGKDAFAALTAVYVRFVVDDMAVHLRDLDLMARLVAAAPTLTLVRPRSFGSLGATADLLARLVHDLASAQAGSDEESRPHER